MNTDSFSEDVRRLIRVRDTKKAVANPPAQDVVEWFPMRKVDTTNNMKYKEAPGV